MAKFEPALKKTLKHEGGYANVEGDKGGETYSGISRVNYPNWTGWAIIDKNKPLKWNAKIKDEALDIAVASFYRIHYWNKMYGENIHNQAVAEFLFDWFVNSGYHGIAAIQKIVDAKPDGVMGTSTLRGINNYSYKDLLDKLIAARTQFVRNIVSKRPTQEKFLAGWMERIDSFKTAA